MHPAVVPYLGFDPMDKDAFAELFDDFVASQGFFVFEEAGAIRGFYRAARHAGRARHGAYLGPLAVAPEEHGTGLAMRMMTDAIERLAAIGVSRVELMVEVDNPRAIAFYRKLGFVEEGRMRGAYKRADERDYVDELFLAKLLPPLAAAR